VLLTISIPASPRKAVLLQLAESADGKTLEKVEVDSQDDEEKKPSGIVLNPDDNPLARLSQKGPRWPLCLIRIAVLALLGGAFMHKEELSRVVSSFLPPANKMSQQVAQQTWRRNQIRNKMQAAEAKRVSWLAHQQHDGVHGEATSAGMHACVIDS
jgi:hypothetical protein